MILHVCRQPALDGAIVGLLSIDGVFACYTLEGVATAIPAGTYDVAITFSNRFQRDLPVLLDVPGHTGIRIHSGNVSADTHGCVLVGRTRGSAAVHDSKLAFGELFERLQAATDPIAIVIEDPAASPQAT